MKNITLQIFILLFAIASTGCGGRDYEYDKNYTLLGKTILFGTPMIYATNLTYYPVSNKLKYSNYLHRATESRSLLDSHFKDGKKEISKIKNDMRFEVIKSYKVIPRGFQASFSSGYRMLVLKDENSLVSVILESSVEKNEILN